MTQGTHEKMIRKNFCAYLLLENMYFLTIAWKSDLARFGLEYYSNAAVSMALKDLAQLEMIQVVPMRKEIPFRRYELVRITQKGRTYIANTGNGYYEIHYRDYEKRFGFVSAKTDLLDTNFTATYNQRIQRVLTKNRVLAMFTAARIPVFPSEKPSLNRLFYSFKALRK